MSSLEQKAADAAAHLAKQNPTTIPGKTAAERRRIPLTAPQRKLEVSEGALPGYHLRWIRGTTARLAQAQNAGFEFVLPEEVQLNNTLIGGDAQRTGGTGLDSRVSVVEGSEIEGGQAVRMYLMKQKMEWYLEDKKLVQDRNDGVADALSSAFQTGAVGGRAQGETAADAALRYVDASRTRRPDLFRRKTS